MSSYLSVQLEPNSSEPGVFARKVDRGITSKMPGGRHPHLDAHQRVRWMQESKHRSVIRGCPRIGPCLDCLEPTCSMASLVWETPPVGCGTAFFSCALFARKHQNLALDGVRCVSTPFKCGVCLCVGNPTSNQLHRKSVGTPCHVLMERSLRFAACHIPLIQAGCKKEGPPISGNKSLDLWVSPFLGTLKMGCFSFSFFSGPRHKNHRVFPFGFP